jgi:hypothetical protein
MGFACGKGTLTNSQGQIDPALMPFFLQSARGMQDYQTQNPLTGFAGSNPEQTAGLTPLEYYGMGGTAALTQESPLSALALGNIMNSTAMAGAGPTTGQYDPSRGLSLADLVNLMNPQRGVVSPAQTNYTPGGGGPTPVYGDNGGYMGPVYTPPGTDGGGGNGGGGNGGGGSQSGPPPKWNDGGMGPQYMMDSYTPPGQQSFAMPGGQPSLYQQSLQNYLGGQSAADYLHGQGVGFNQGPSAGTGFTYNGGTYQNMGASHEGAGPGGESQFLINQGVQSGQSGPYSGDVAKMDKAMANVAQSNFHQKVAGLTTAQKQAMAASGKDIFGNPVGGSKLPPKSTPPATTGDSGAMASPILSEGNQYGGNKTTTLDRSGDSGGQTATAMQADSYTPPAQASSYTPPAQTGQTGFGATPQGGAWVPAPRQTPQLPTPRGPVPTSPQGPAPGTPQRPIDPNAPPAKPPFYPNPRPGDPGYNPGTVPPYDPRSIGMTGGPNMSSLQDLQGQMLNGGLTGATPFGQSPGIQAAQQRVQGVDIMNDPAVASALKNFEQIGSQPIKNEAALAGLGNSSALTNSLGQAESSMMTPLYLDAINREQQRLQGVTGATESELDRRERSNVRQSEANQNSINQLLALQGQNFGQQLQGSQAQLQAGGIQRGVEQQGNENAYNDFLRQQALSENALEGPFGGMLPSAFGSITKTQGK